MILYQKNFKMKREDLNDKKYEYSDHAVGGDNPKKRILDSSLLNRSESYEVLDFINSFQPKNLKEGSFIEDRIHEYELRSQSELRNEIEKVLTVNRLLKKF